MIRIPDQSDVNATKDAAAPSQSDKDRARKLAIAILIDCAMRYIEGPQSQVDRAIDLGQRTVLSALTEATLAERERCAKVADTLPVGEVIVGDGRYEDERAEDYGARVADAIRGNP